MCDQQKDHENVNENQSPQIKTFLLAQIQSELNWHKFA